MVRMVVGQKNGIDMFDGDPLLMQSNLSAFPAVNQKRMSIEP